MHNKLDLAIEQLEIALFLFINDRSYVAALTLAGAAEDILGKAVEINGLKNSLQESYRIYSIPGLSWINPPKTWSEVYKK